MAPPPLPGTAWDSRRPPTARYGSTAAVMAVSACILDFSPFFKLSAKFGNNFSWYLRLTPTLHLGARLRYRNDADYNQNFGFFGDLYQYDASSSTWTQIDPSGSVPSARYSMGFAATPDGRLWVFGGWSGNDYRSKICTNFPAPDS